MSQNDLLFLVLIAIGLASLTMIAIRLIKPHRKDNAGEWYEGPWEDDDRPRRPRR